jgi:hypothetical protein
MLLLPFYNHTNTSLPLKSDLSQNRVAAISRYLIAKIQIIMEIKRNFTRKNDSKHKKYNISRFNKTIASLKAPKKDQ